MSQGRISPATIMMAAAAMLARSSPGMFANVGLPTKRDNRHPKLSKARGKINRGASPGHGALTLAANSSIKKRMRIAARSGGGGRASPQMKYRNSGAGRSCVPARW